MPTGEIKLESPPELPEHSARGPSVSVLPLALLTAAMTAALALATRQNLLLFAGLELYTLVLAGLVGVLLLGRTRPRAVLREQVGRYLAYLGAMREDVRRNSRKQRAAREWSNPPPGLLWSMPLSDRLWERRPGDQDFGQARVGTGAQTQEAELVAPGTAPIDELEPLTAGSLARFIRAYRAIPDLPVSIQLDSFPRVRLSGDRAAIQGMVRAMLMQLATFHSPDDLRISVCAAADRMPSWEWLKWLPHARHPAEQDVAGLVRLVAPSLDRLERLLGDDLDEREPYGDRSLHDLPLHVIVLDGGQVTAGSRLAGGVGGVCLLDLGGSTSGPGFELDVGPEWVRIVGEPGVLGRPDQPTVGQAEALARQLAALRPDSDLIGHAPAPSLADLCRTPRASLTVPLGVDRSGTTVELDLTAGDTVVVGDGRADAVTAIVLGLALSHLPERLSIALLATRAGRFADLARLPHVCAIADGLADDSAQCGRIILALRGEVERRRRAAARGEGKDQPPLVVVVDDFAGLQNSTAGMAELLRQIAEAGPYGMHLVLAAPRPRTGESSDRPAQVFNAANRVALRLPWKDAAVMDLVAARSLPPRGYAVVQRAPGSEPIPVRLAEISASSRSSAAGARRVVPFRLESTGPMPDRAAGESAARSMAELLRETHEPVRALLHPPLERPPTLKGVVPAPPRHKTLEVVAGLLDDPYDRVQEPYTFPVHGSGAHVGVIGRARSGKTTLLRSLVCSLALRYKADQLRFHLVGEGDGLGSLAGLPHVAGMTPYEKDRPDAAGLAELLHHELSGYETAGHTFLVIDDWPEPPDATALCQSVYEWLVDTPGSHLMISARAWSGLHPEVVALLKHRLELRLEDPAQSRIDVSAAGYVPVRRPGRGLTTEGLHFLAALPRIDGVRSAEHGDEALAALIRHVKETAR